MKIGDRVICMINGICGVIIQTYTPNACEMQILVRTDDGRFYHAPCKHEYHSRADLMIGKTVFLTCEEAEKALRREQYDEEHHIL